MKILQVGKFYPVLGGVEKVMWDLTLGLNASGMHCDMLCAKFPGDVISEEDKEAMGGHLICCRAWKKLSGTMIAPSMIVWLRRHCREYDIIHIHHPDPMAALALRLCGYDGRVILHWHSDIVSQQFGLALYRPLQSWLIRRAERIVGTTPVYVSQSVWLKDSRHKICHVPIGISPVRYDEELVRAISDRYSGKHLVLAAGRLVPYKGYDVLIRSFSLLPEDYCLVIIGQGPLMDQMVALTEELGVSDRVSFLGHVPDKELYSYMAASEVLALTSVMKSEAFGIVQIEAFSCSVPVVSTRIPESGVSWVNADGISGLTVPVRDAEAAAAAIRSICEDATMRDKLSVGARLRYEQLFTLKRMTENIMNIYEE